MDGRGIKEVGPPCSHGGFCTIRKKEETAMTFGDALEYAKAGRSVRRAGWMPGDEVVCHYTEDMQPFLEVSCPGHEPVPYFAGNVDIFADDWEIVRK